MILNIQDLDFHKSVANRQRDAYNSMKKNLENDYILIEIDWKQKIMIGIFLNEFSSII